MRTKKTDNQKSKYPKLDLTKTEHERDLEALAAAKAMEARMREKCVSVRLDDKTTIVAHADHIDKIIKRCNQQVPTFNPNQQQSWKN